MPNKKTTMKTSLNCLIVALALCAGINHAAAQGTVFTYQGKLADSGLTANGTNYGMAFYLYDAPTNGILLGNLGVPSVTVTNGLFMVPLDFGNEFDGTPRWLQITVQKNGGAFTPLFPRQQLTPTPYAIFANTASNLSGTVPLAQLPNSVVVNNASGVSLNGTFSGDGSGLGNTVTTGNYVNAYDTTTQTTVTANTYQGISFTAASTSGWLYFGGSGRSFTCNQAGMYLVQYDAQVATTTSSSTTISLRAYNEGVANEIPGSEASVTLSVANQPVMASKSFLTYFSVGNLLQFQFTGNNISAELIGGNGAGNEKPSFSCTIIRIQ